MSSMPGATTAADLAETPAQIEPQGKTYLVLEIIRGRTRFPNRPVAGPRFLIGAGVTCDMRLGGQNIPALHSLITRGDEGPEIEAIAATPALIVNGQQVHTARLSDGDTIHIGEVELVAHVTAIRPAAEVPLQVAVAQDTPAPSELSALELVERVEAEQRQIERFEARRELGAQALLQAAQLGRQAALEPAPHARVPAPHFLSKRPQVLAAQNRAAPTQGDDSFLRDLSQVGAHLSSLSQEIRNNSARAKDREAHLVEAADTLLDTQERLAEQLEAVIEHVASAPPALPLAKPRAIA